MSLQSRCYRFNRLVIHLTRWHLVVYFLISAKLLKSPDLFNWSVRQYQKKCRVFCYWVSLNCDKIITSLQHWLRTDTEIIWGSKYCYRKYLRLPPVLIYLWTGWAARVTIAKSEISILRTNNRIHDGLIDGS